MNLMKYDNKCVRIIDLDNKVFEGNCYYNDKEYNNHEYGRNEDSLQILNIMFYESTTKDVKEIENLSNKEYGSLEESIIADSDLDFIEDALDTDDQIHRDRLILCIKDNINKFDDRINEIVGNSIKDYKKYIFDVDYTLLIPNWSKEDEFLRKNIPFEEQEEFFK